MEAIFELAGTVKGFLDVAEGMRLYELAAEASQWGPCLEIGSYCGKSAIYMGAACKMNGMTLYSVDHHRGSEEQQPGELYFDAELFDPFYYRVDTLKYFRQTIMHGALEDTVVPLVAASETAARHWATPLSLVFIDGGHAYETVFNDYTCWHRHVLPDGYLIFHDVYVDPTDGGQAPYEVYQLAAASGRYRALPMTGSLGILKRIS